MKEKYFCAQIHTERLHNDMVWRQVQKFLHYFMKHDVHATWFSINPSFAGYRAMEFDEQKWKERLKRISDAGQDIQQHTHFYVGKKGMPKGEGYDMSKEHIEKRLLEDKRWLESRGFDVGGFVSGAWYVNDDFFKTLSENGYLYDSSVRGRSLENKFGVLEIPSSARIRQLLFMKLGGRFIKIPGGRACVLSFHDYDLENLIFRAALFAILKIFKFLGFKFVSTSGLYKSIGDF